jgi:integrase
MRLSQTRADKIKSPGRYSDGRGLYLQITKAEHRSWIFRFELNGRERFMGLGPCADFTLEEARERARLARQLLKDGIDPLDAGHEQRAKRAQEAAKVITFKAAADAYYDFHSPKWENEKHKSQFRSRLSEYVFPVMGALPVAAIDKPIILKTIQPIWNTKNATAARTLGLVKSVLDYAKASGWRDGDNPAAWSGNLSNALPTHSSKNHHAALPFAEVYKFMKSLSATETNTAAQALEFAILTAARTGEVRFARWGEIDLGAKLWTIPADRMKARRPHRVPLSARALAILNAAPREEDDGFLFIGARAGQPLGHQALDQVLKRINPAVTVHGFRSTFRDWAGETTNYPNHVVEMALAHSIGSAVEAAYRRGDLLAQRVRLMEDWASYCAKPAATGNIVPIRKAAGA